MSNLTIVAILIERPTPYQDKYAQRQYIDWEQRARKVYALAWNGKTTERFSMGFQYVSDEGNILIKVSCANKSSMFFKLYRAAYGFRETIHLYRSVVHGISSIHDLMFPLLGKSFTRRAPPGKPQKGQKKTKANSFDYYKSPKATKPPACIDFTLYGYEFAYLAPGFVLVNLYEDQIGSWSQQT